MTNTARGVAAPYVAGYGALWAAATGYLALRHADWVFPVFSLAIFGLALSGIAWLTTRGAKPRPVTVEQPALELGVVIAYLAVYALVFLGWGMGALRAAIPAGQAQELAVLAAKLTVHVAAPVLILGLLGARIAPLFGGAASRKGVLLTLMVLGPILIGLLCVVSPSLKQIGALHPSPAELLWAAPFAFVWIALEAGLCEEVLFRAVLQTRLAAVLLSEAGAVLIGAVIFALCHAPGLYLRGGPGVDGWSTDPVQVAAFTIATLSPIAVMFGLIWARTRSLLLVVLLHASVDVLPNLPETLKIWAGLGGA